MEKLSEEMLKTIHERTPFLGSEPIKSAISFFYRKFYDFISPDAFVIFKDALVTCQTNDFNDMDRILFEANQNDGSYILGVTGSGTTVNRSDPSSS